MTEIERKWVESRWEYEWSRDLSAVWLERGIDEDALVFLSVEYWPDAFNRKGYRPWVSLGIDDEILGPDTDSIAEAKADAEAMYRQWVYDEYGVVLP